MEPILNSQLPEFSVQAFHNGAFKTVTNNDLKGKWAILFFYPADFTFVCPTELVDMAEKYDQFKAMGVEIYSVSTDSHFVHKAWHDASESIRKIQYPMLADHRNRAQSWICQQVSSLRKSAMTKQPIWESTTSPYNISCYP